MITRFRKAIKTYDFSLSAIYQIAGISRQGYHQQVKRNRERSFLITRLIELTKDIRKDHPRLGARTLFIMLKLKGIIGINKYERLLSEMGLGIKLKRKVLYITTDSNHLFRKFKNLINGYRLTGVNQVWASDITCYMIGKTVYYISLMMDVYSRRILAYKVSDNLFHTNNLEVLENSFKLRKGADLSMLIHHSDKGSQYCSKAYTQALKDAKVKISMARTAIENPYAERLNGIIKNDYLYPRKRAKDFKSLCKELDIVVRLYNEERPHSELNDLTPVEFERRLLEQEHNKHPVMELYDFNLKREERVFSGINE